MSETYGNYSYPNYCYQNWMLQNPYAGNMNWGYYNPMQNYNPIFQGAPQNTGTSATGATNTATLPATTTTSAADNIKKAYVAIDKNVYGLRSKTETIYETTPEKLAEFKQKSKKDKIARNIVGIATLGLSFFGIYKYGPKAFDFISDGLKNLVKNSKYDDLIDFGTIFGLTMGTMLPGTLIATSNRKQKKLAAEYFPESTVVQKSDKQIKKDQK